MLNRFDVAEMSQDDMEYIARRAAIAGGVLAVASVVVVIGFALFQLAQLIGQVP